MKSLPVQAANLACTSDRWEGDKARIAGAVAVGVFVEEITVVCMYMYGVVSKNRR